MKHMYGDYLRLYRTRTRFCPHAVLLGLRTGITSATASTTLIARRSRLGATILHTIIREQL